MEENNRKRLAEATLHVFELLEPVSKSSPSETTTSARSPMRCEKVVQDWINTSLTLSFNKDDKTGEPEVTIDPPECPSHNNGEKVDHQNIEFQGILFQKIVEAITFEAVRPYSNSILLYPN